LGATTNTVSYAVTSAINGDTMTIGGAVGSAAAGATGGFIGGHFPSINNTHFVDNASDYLLREGAGSFARGFLGTTLTNGAGNLVHPSRKTCVEEGVCQ
jgi:hypothetical protein